MSDFTSFERNADPRSPAQGGRHTGPWAPCYAGIVRPGCGTKVKPLCDVQKVGNIVRAIAPQTTWTINPAPLRSDMFQALAMRNTVTSNTDPSVNARLFIQTVTVNRFPQEAFSDASGIAVLSGVWSDDYVLPDGYGVPVSWAPFAQENLVKTLTIGGANLYPTGGLTVDYQVSLYGNALESEACG